MGDEVSGTLDYVNINGLIGALVSSGKATMHELDTVYSIEDAYDMLEVLRVDAHNRRIMNKRA